jgi:hypothetical protein
MGQKSFAQFYDCGTLLPFFLFLFSEGELIEAVNFRFGLVRNAESTLRPERVLLIHYLFGKSKIALLDFFAIGRKTIIGQRNYVIFPPFYGLLGATLCISFAHTIHYFCW